MKKLVLLILTTSVIFLISSCCKAIFDSKNILNNTTNQDIELRLYNQGQFSTFFLSKNTDMTAPDELFYDPKMADSVLVLKNDLLQETHYSIKITKTPRNATVFGYTNQYNLLNTENYQKSVAKLDCDGSFTTNIYLFK